MEEIVLGSLEGKRGGRKKWERGRMRQVPQNEKKIKVRKSFFGVGTEPHSLELGYW